MNNKITLFLSAFLMYFSSVSAQQIIKGDMNDDGKVSVNDFVMFLDVVLGNTSVSTISVKELIDLNTVDNSIVAGTWFKTKYDSIVFELDGTTNYSGASRYEYLPYKKNLILYDSESDTVGTLNVLKVTEDNLYIRDCRQIVRRNITI